MKVHDRLGVSSSSESKPSYMFSWPSSVSIMEEFQGRHHQSPFLGGRARQGGVDASCVMSRGVRRARSWRCRNPGLIVCFKKKTFLSLYVCKVRSWGTAPSSAPCFFPPFTGQFVRVGEGENEISIFKLLSPSPDYFYLLALRS